MKLSVLCSGLLGHLIPVFLFTSGERNQFRCYSFNQGQACSA